MACCVVQFLVETGSVCGNRMFVLVTTKCICYSVMWERGEPAWHSMFSSGPEVDTPEDKKQLGLDPATYALSSRPSSSLSAPTHHHQYSNQNSSVYSQPIKRPRSDSAPATTTSICVTRVLLKEGGGSGHFKLAVPSEPESTSQGNAL